MAKFQKIPKAQAPVPAKPSGRLQARMKLYEEHVAAVGPGEVGVLVPDRVETTRSLALRIGRAARRINKPVKTWIDKGTVYFELVS